MKKGLMMLGVAAIALASCTQNEVVDVVESRAIGFDSFVGKTTKAINDIATADLTNFYVFGSCSTDGNNLPEVPNVFNNTGVSGGEGNWATEKTEYWSDTQNYKFVAYSNGNDKLTNASFANGAFAITGYTVADKDLIASEIVSQAGTKHDAVNVTLKHLLAKVKFTITNKLAAGNKIEISALKIAQVPNTGNYNGTNWEPSTSKADIEFAMATIETTAPQASDEFYVMPQTGKFTVSFTATVKSASGVIIKSTSFTSEIDGWTKNNAYNYTVELTEEDVKVDQNVITFTPTVDTWGQYGQGTPIEPTPAN